MKTHDDKAIKREHLKQFDFIAKHKLKIGSKLLIKTKYDREPQQATIKWINRFYGWFGETEQINLNDIVRVL